MRYQVNDVPPQHPGAFCPVLVVNPVASSFGRVHVSGSPGTMPIPAPHPAATPDWSYDPKTIPSNCSPDIILPAIYTVDSIERPPVPIRNHNPLPVPAVNPQRVAIPAMISPKIGGRAAIPWPRVFQRWPSVTGRGTGG